MGMPLVGLDTAQNAHNALEHGLLGNGSANDQPALAALVERLGGEVKRDGRPRVIYCPPGEYLIAEATTGRRGGRPLSLRRRGCRRGGGVGAGGGGGRPAGGGGGGARPPPPAPTPPPPPRG